MDKFEHRLRTTLHTRSVQNIMTRTHGFLQKSKDYKLSSPKFDNISTFLRKFQIDRQNLNLAKRIVQCESEHNRTKYVKQWKKTKKFLKVRSNFKPQFTAQEPKFYRVQEIPGRGRLMVKVEITEIVSNMKQINSQCFYLLKFGLGGNHLIANKDFLTFQTAQGYTCVFLAPHFLKNKPILVKLIKVVQNNLFEAGKLSIDLSKVGEQHCQIINKTGKSIGHIAFKLEVEVRQREAKCDESKQNTLRESALIQRQSLTETL